MNPLVYAEISNIRIKKYKYKYINLLYKRIFESFFFFQIKRYVIVTHLNLIRKAEQEQKWNRFKILKIGRRKKKKGMRSLFSRKRIELLKKKKTYRWNVKFKKEAIMISKGKFTETVRKLFILYIIYIIPNKYIMTKIQRAILL